MATGYDPSTMLSRVRPCYPLPLNYDLDAVLDILRP